MKLKAIGCFLFAIALFVTAVHTHMETGEKQYLQPILAAFCIFTGIQEWCKHD
jgi:hypothetical protein